MAAKKPMPFGKAFEELETITRWFERGEAQDLEEGIAKFERGMALAKDLRERLAVAEVKIEEVRTKFGA